MANGFVRLTKTGVGGGGTTSLEVGTTSITNGTVGRVLFEGTGNVLQESANLFWNNTNSRLGIGTETPLGVLHLKETAQTTRFLIDGDAGQSKIITFRTSGLQRFGVYCNNIAESGGNSGSNLAIRNYNDAGTLIGTPFYIFRASGNVLINSTTDAGYKFDVNGTTRINGNATFGTLATGTGMFWDNTNNRLGIGTASPTYALTIESDSNTNIRLTDTTNSAYVDLSVGNFDASLASSGRIFIQSSTTFSVNTTNVGIGVANPINAKFQVSGSVLFGASTATGMSWDNVNNRLGIGTPTPTGSVTVIGAYASANVAPLVVQNTTPYGGSANQYSQVWIGSNGTLMGYVRNDGRLYTTNDINSNYFVTNTTGSASSPIFRGGANGMYFPTTNTIAFSNNSVETMRLFSTNNIAIGTTTDAGYKLDVNGTTRTSGTALFQNSSFGTAIQINNQNGSTFSLGIISNAAADTNFATQSNYNGNNFRITAAGFAMGRGGLPTLDASALLNINSTTQGFLPPRMTTTEKNAIATPASGLVVYDTTLGKLCVRGASAWETITSV